MVLTVSNRYRNLLACGLLVAAVIGVYRDVGAQKPIPFDDLLYVTGNHYVLRGLTWEGIWWAWTNVDAANWHPITWLSHMADQHFFRRFMGVQMFENVLWHAVNTSLVYALMRRFFPHRGLAFALALVFGCHPQNVESVAWLSQRKNQLSTFFLLTTVLVYFDFRETGRRSSMIIMMAAYATSLMAKAMGITLPVILFAYEVIKTGTPLWHQRIGTWARAEWQLLGLTVRKAAFHQLPFVLSALCIAVVSLWAQADRGAVASVEVVPIAGRFANAFRSLGVYFNTFLVPTDLCFFYPLKDQIPSGETLYGILLALSLTLLAVGGIRRVPSAVFGIVWFCIGLLPVIGLVQVGSQSHADRYMYVPMIGLLIAVGAVLSEVVFVHVRYPRVMASVLITAFGVGMGVHAHAYVMHWRDAETAYRRSIDIGGVSYTMVANLASIHSNTGFPKAGLLFNKIAYQIQPNAPLAVANMAGSYALLGKWEDAAKWYYRAIQLAPTKPQHYFNLGMVLANMDRGQESEQILNRAKELLPPKADWDKSTEYVRAMLERRVVPAVVATTTTPALSGVPTD